MIWLQWSVMNADLSALARMAGNHMKGTVIEQIRDAVEVDSYWPPYLDELVMTQPPSVSVHLGIFAEPYLQYVLDGTKTVESRFSVRPCPPYRQVADGDILLLKQVGGPIVGLCQIGTVWFYDLAPETLCELRSEFAGALCAQDPDFWTHREGASFATLMQLGQVREVDPIQIEKRDRRGWVVLRPRSQQLRLWND